MFDELVRLVRAPQVQLGDLPRLHARRRGARRKFSGSRAVGNTASTVTCPTARWSGWLTHSLLTNRTVGSWVITISGRTARMARVIRSRSASDGLDLAVRLVEEVDALTPSRGRGCAARARAARPARRRRRRVVAALVAARDQQVADRRRPRPTHRATVPAGAELDVVRMRGHHEDAFGGGQLSSGMGSAAIVAAMGPECERPVPSRVEQLGRPRVAGEVEDLVTRRRGCGRPPPHARRARRRS